MDGTALAADSRAYGENLMHDSIDHERRRFLGTALMTVAAAELRGIAPSERSGVARRRRSEMPEPLGPVKQIDAGVLNVGYVDAGRTDAPAVILLHGWPYDIHSFDEVVPMLIASGHRVIVPYLRGYGSTR